RWAHRLGGGLLLARLLPRAPGSLVAPGGRRARRAPPRLRRCRAVAPLALAAGAGRAGLRARAESGEHRLDAGPPPRPAVRGRRRGGARARVAVAPRG